MTTVRFQSRRYRLTTLASLALSQALFVAIAGNVALDVAADRTVGTSDGPATLVLILGFVFTYLSVMGFVAYSRMNSALEAEYPDVRVRVVMPVSGRGEWICHEELGLYSVDLVAGIARLRRDRPASRVPWIFTWQFVVALSVPLLGPGRLSGVDASHPVVSSLNGLERFDLQEVNRISVWDAIRITLFIGFPKYVMEDIAWKKHASRRQ